MLLYVENKAFKLRTFIVLCSAGDSIARIRANLLHSLHEIGHSKHQFRYLFSTILFVVLFFKLLLQYRGTYLRDAYTLEEYKILNNAVIQMIPLDDFEEWQKDKKFYQLSAKEKAEHADDVVQKALQKEIIHLNKREFILNNFKIFLIMQILMAFLAIVTIYWYFCLIYLAVLFIAYLLIPSFTRIGGWVGKTSVRKREFMIGYGVLSILMVCAGVALFVLTVVDLSSSDYPTTTCLNQYSSCFENAQDAISEYTCSSMQNLCYQTAVWTAIYFALEMVIMIATSVLCWILMKNFEFEVGDMIEKQLLRSREIGDIMKMAKHGSTSEKRNAAFELATLASSGDENRYQITNEEGLDVLLTLCLSNDPATQEYATEAIAECLTLKSIQDQFVEIGGLKSLTALLHLKHQRTLNEAITAISYIVSDSDENKTSVIEDNGLGDLYAAAKTANSSGRKLLATMYLELAYYDISRNLMASRSVTLDGIVTAASRSKDEQTILISLQALELLSIESSQLITYHEKLMNFLLLLPSKVLDKNIHYLVTKLLIVFAENTETCKKLALDLSIIKTMLHLLHGSDGNLQKALSVLALHLSEVYQARESLSKNGLEEFLSYIQNTSSDRETWNILEQTLSNLKIPGTSNDSPLKQISKSSISSSAYKPQPVLRNMSRTSIRSVSSQPGTSRMY